MNRISVKNKNNESMTISPFGYRVSTNEYLYHVTKYYKYTAVTLTFNREDTKNVFINFIKDKHYRFNAMGLYYEEV